MGKRGLARLQGKLAHSPSHLLHLAGQAEPGAGDPFTAEINIEHDLFGNYFKIFFPLQLPVWSFLPRRGQLSGRGPHSCYW